MELNDAIQQLEVALAQKDATIKDLCRFIDRVDDQALKAQLLAAFLNYQQCITYCVVVAFEVRRLREEASNEATFFDENTRFGLMN